MDSISNFITHLSLITLPESWKATNLYYGNSELSVVRRDNLRIYLERMLLLNPSVLIVGEAPGCNGCRLTGIPFTSEFIL
jgi:uracil-DNA glycosylase